MDENDINSIPIYKIAITGKMGSGKSTLAKILNNQLDGNITSFSSQIRKVISLTGLPIERKILQATGDFFRSFNNVVWVDMLLKDAENNKLSAIIDGIRYPFEATDLIKNEFKIIKITSIESLRRKRISARDQIDISNEIWQEWTSHPTEKNLTEISFDYSIDNNKSIEQLKTDALAILKAMRIKK